MKCNRRILIIDDQEELRNEIKNILLRYDKKEDILSDIEGLISDFSDFAIDKKKEQVYDEYEVDTASNGKEGLEMVKQAANEGRPYVLCFIDMRMPGWGGTKTAKEIRIFQIDMEIVIITAYSDVKCIDIVEEVGAPQKILFLKKPFDKEEVSQLAWALTEKWNLEKENQTYLRSLEIAREGLITIVEILKNIDLFSMLTVNKLVEAISKQMLSLFYLESVYIYTLEEDNLLKLSVNIGDVKTVEHDILFEEKYPEILKKISPSFQSLVDHKTLFFPIAVNNKIVTISVFKKENTIPYPVETFNMLAESIKRIAENSMSMPAKTK